ncbi:MAG: hypothetical protein GY714_09725 [Desulfobacterales bacterium]|nr:hypothetical protein [Desulfobacterales bacterium]
MTPQEIKKKRRTLDYSQKLMAENLDIHQNALQKMEYGTRTVPQYIGNYASCLTLLNENKLLQKHIDQKRIEMMTPKELKDIRESFDFRQKLMAEILGIHPNALKRMEYGTSPVPKYIGNHASSLTILNENRLLRKHIAQLGIELG